jgi:single-stranded-DNA-specific exonuclease
LRNRELVTDEEISAYLQGTIDDLPDGSTCADMEKAVDILSLKIKQGKKIRIIGDYDIDGVNATYVYLRVLSALGAVVDYAIPHRMTDGYGLNIELVKSAINAKVDTILTCDNGIAAKSEIEFAKEAGLTVIVTDHHEVPFGHLPQGDAIVDSKRPDCPYPFKGLCGTAIAWKLANLLANKYLESKTISNLLDSLIENVAIATIGDVMDLNGENRILVKEGLKRLQNTNNLGLRALIKETGLEGHEIRAYHIGFVLGPCINASGRLESAQMALELLLSDSNEEAQRMAAELKSLNDSRKNMTDLALDEAFPIACELVEKGDKVLVIYLPQCHESLAGIVAGRIRESFYRPVFVLTDGEEGIKGSGRSIESYHMFEGISACADLLDKFGGHAQAAGLSMKRENLTDFRKRINDNCNLTDEDLKEKIKIDMVLPFSAVNESFIKEIELLAPFGKGNRKPVFACRNVRLKSLRVFGENRNVIIMQLTDENDCQVEGIMFGEHRELEAKKASTDKEILMDILFEPAIKEYNGRKSLQIKLQEYRIK